MVETWDPDKTSETPCDHEGCPRTIKDHMWGRIKAEGWFFTKTGKAYCPDHRPEWVAAWRKRKKEKNGSSPR